MTTNDETELIAYIHELLESNFSPEMRVIESDDPNDSPVIVLNYKGTQYAIAVEELHRKEE